MEDEQFETEDWHDTEEIGSQLEQVNLKHPAAHARSDRPLCPHRCVWIAPSTHLLKVSSSFENEGKKCASLLFPRTTPLVAAVC